MRHFHSTQISPDLHTRSEDAEWNNGGYTVRVSMQIRSMKTIGIVRESGPPARAAIPSFQPPPSNRNFTFPYFLISFPPIPRLRLSSHQTFKIIKHHRSYYNFDKEDRWVEKIHWNRGVLCFDYASTIKKHAILALFLTLYANCWKIRRNLRLSHSQTSD